jgi:glyoxylase-like metal-dependent hydrolase (beta-lactamase superfamily II)
MSGDETYQIHAVKYAHYGERRASANFIEGDPHDGPMPLDYFVWAIQGGGRTFVLDTGFDRAMGEKRKRGLIRSPGEGLRAIGIEPDTVEDVILSHMHFDHAGNHALFPRARFHVQDREMQYCTGRCMGHHFLRLPFEVEDVVAMVRRVFTGRAVFHDGTSEIAPGITVHHVGGHSSGLQVVRVRTRRGWVVLASDASHLYANFEQARPFPIVANVIEMLEGYRTLYALASSPQHIIPGHDPLVLARYPASAPGLEGMVVRLDADPIG